MIILPGLTTLFAFLALAGRRERAGAPVPLRESLVFTFLWLSVFVYGATEILGLGTWLTGGGIAIAWSVALIACAGAWAQSGRPIPRWRASQPLDGFEKFLVAGIALVFAGTLVVDLVAHPNNWDSMSYHLARVMHWIQDRGVFYFPTEIDRQVSQPPLAEYWMLHFRLLSSNDRVFNLVQWIFMTGTVACASLIARELGGRRASQLLTAFFVATLPSGILLATATENEWVAAFFITAALYFLTRGWKPGLEKQYRLPFLISCGMAAVTHGLGFIYLPVVVLYFCGDAFRRLGRVAWRYVAAGAFVFLLLYGPVALRHVVTYGQPWGNTMGVLNARHAPAGILSNAGKDIASNFWTPFRRVNDKIAAAVVRASWAIGADPLSWDYTYRGAERFDAALFSTHEGYAGNPLHVLLFGASLAVLAFAALSGRPAPRPIGSFAVLLLAMFVSFCALLKWQQYDTRLQLPLLVAAGPIVAVTIARAGRPVIRWTATAPLFLFAIVFLLFNECRPFVTARSIFHRPAADQYFADNPSYEPGFTGAAAIIRRDRIRQIGLATTHDTFEYPLWVYLSDVRGLRMENIAPRNGTARYEKFPPFNTFTPDAIVATRTELLTASELIYRHRRYRRSFAGGGVALFERAKEGA